MVHKSIKEGEGERVKKGRVVVVVGCMSVMHLSVAVYQIMIMSIS